MTKRLLMIVLVHVLLCGLTLVPPSTTTTQASTDQTYLVLFKQEKVPSNASALIVQAGGSLTYTYDEIGVAIAHSGNPDFGAELLADKSIQGVSSTAGFGVQYEEELVEFTTQPAHLPAISPTPLSTIPIPL